MYTPTIPLPNAPVSEWTFVNTATAMGLFKYRHVQAVGLLDFPDFGGGDLNEQERRDALKRAINFQKPLAALSIFLGVVAIEDFVRDLGARMADNTNLNSHFPNLARLRSAPKPRLPKHAFRRLDTDPTGKIDPEDINDLFYSALGVRPIPFAEFPRLRDRALIRHTVAHHAAVIRVVDVPRFQYYIVTPGQGINPPSDFVRETLEYLHKTGSLIEEVIRDGVFAVILPTLGPKWWNVRPPQLMEMIELFNYFGFIETAIGPVGYVEKGTPEYKQRKDEENQVKEKLILRCIAELRSKHGP